MLRKELIWIFVLISFLVFATEYFIEDQRLCISPKPNSGGTLTLTISSLPESFLIYGTLDSSSYAVVMGPMMSTLVEYHPITSQIRPGLAKSWIVSDDGKTVWFYLREAYWSDGQPITSDDVLFTMQYFVMNKYAVGNQIDRFMIPDENKVIRPVKWFKESDKVVRAELPAPYGAFFSVLTAIYIYPKHKLENLIDKNNLSSVNKIWGPNTPPSQIVVNGPYKVSQIIPNKKIVLERNPYFWKKDPYGNKLPYFDKLEFLIIRDSETFINKFINGEIDYTGISSTVYPRLKDRT